MPTQRDLLAALGREGISDARLLDAVGAVPRASFVSESAVDRAYLDIPLAIPHDQVTTQPSLVAKMLESLELTGDERVLEIGTGFGWQTALLAHLAWEVWSIERWPDLAETARRNLLGEGVGNATVVVGDGSEGFAEQAPYAAIVVSAAFTSVPPALAAQLLHGGRLVQPIGPGGREDVMLFEQRQEGLVARGTITRAHFVRLVARQGFSGRRAQSGRARGRCDPPCRAAPPAARRPEGRGRDHASAGGRDWSGRAARLGAAGVVEKTLSRTWGGGLVLGRHRRMGGGWPVRGRGAAGRGRPWLVLRG